MLDKRIEDAVNDQINYELYSAYIYYSMQAWFEDKSFTGMTTWMAAQVKEEMSHAQIMYNFINDRGGRVILKAIEGPQTDWESPLDVFETALEHEKKVTARINKILDVATELHDHASIQFLHWFVNEQIEEENNASEIIDRLTFAADNRGAVFHIDTELGARVFTLPAPLAAAGA
jgi:ferritin